MKFSAIHSRRTLLALISVLSILFVSGCGEFDDVEITCDYADCEGDNEAIVGTWLQRECVEYEDSENRDAIAGNFAKARLVVFNNGVITQTVQRYTDEDCRVEGSNYVPNVAYRYSTGDLVVDENGLLATRLIIDFSGDSGIGADPSFTIGAGRAEGHYYVSEGAGLCFSDQFVFDPENTNLNSGALSGTLQMDDCFDRQ